MRTLLNNNDFRHLPTAASSPFTLDVIVSPRVGHVRVGFVRSPYAHFKRPLVCPFASGRFDSAHVDHRFGIRDAPHSVGMF